LLTEMQHMAEHVVVISRGNLIADESAESFVNRSTRNDVLVRTPNRSQLESALRVAGIQATPDGDDGLAVAAHATAAIGDVAFANHIAIHELTRRSASLEEAFLELTAGQQDYAPRGGTK
jgi:ABC-2 type transport system ATP-binding protein